jgi:hypothetical protein
MPGVWPQRGYDGGRTGYNPDAAGVPSGIDERLSFELPSGYDETVTVRDVLVAPDEYVVAGGEVVAGYDRAGGERTWRRWFEHVTGTPVLDGGWVVVGSRDRVHGVERAADRHEWVTRLDRQPYGVVSALAGQGGSVYVAGRGGSENEVGSVAVLDPATGAPDRGRGTSGVGWLFVTDDHVVYQWSEFFSSGVTVLDTALESERELTGHGGPNPPDDVTRLRPRLVGNGTVYGTETGDPADELVARDLDTGAVCWRRPLDSGLNAPPAVVRDILYVWDASGLVALNSHTGDVLWRCGEARREPDSGSDADESMVAALSSLVLGGERPMAVDPDTGDVLWTHEVPFTVHALVDDELVASRGDEVLVFRDSDSSGTDVYGAACPACGADLDGRGAPAFCPDCGASLDG